MLDGLGLAIAIMCGLLFVFGFGIGALLTTCIIPKPARETTDGKFVRRYQGVIILMMAVLFIATNWW